MTLQPLVSHVSNDSLIAWRADGAVTRQRFISEIHQLAALFPASGHLLNLCRDRYQFSVGLAAAVVTGRISLLPSNHTPETLRQIKAFAPDTFCLVDHDQSTVDMPVVRYPQMVDTRSDDLFVPQIDADQLAAIVFTSGTTGAPQPHPKTWGALICSVHVEATRLGLLNKTGCTIVGTVPPQHMYGFESTILLPWHSHSAFSHAQPFYPADICQALAAVPSPRILVSSPMHLRALMDSGLTLPKIETVVSATAPLSTPLAQIIEQRCDAQLIEIYGSTETGQIASRRPTHQSEWNLFPGIRLSTDGENVQAYGGHIGRPTILNDVIEPVADEHFLFHGRKSDLVNIAGKRHSLASLNHLLTSISGVVDGAFFVPDDVSPDSVTRLVACVVAPELDSSMLMAALRERIDPVFLPRPLLFVEALPRNCTGKLPREALQSLVQSRCAQKSA